MRTPASLVWRFLFALLIFSGLSCSTELDVNAPYQETKVIYALLNPQEPYQLIRITKAFLNEGRNAYDIARNSPDSSWIPSNVLEVRLTEFKTVNGQQNQTRSWLLKDTVFTTKDSGTFYSPDQLMYKTPRLVLDTGKTQNVVYEISVRNTKTGSVSTARSPLCGRILKSNDYLEFRNPYYSSGSISVGFSSLNPSIYQVVFPYSAEFMEMNFVWTIETTRLSGGVQVTDTEEWVWSEPGRFFFRANNPLGEATVAPGAFVNFFLAKAKAINNTNVVRRRIAGLRFDVFTATSEYRKYVAVNGAYNPITQSKPIYSNVTNGLGLFAGKNYSRVPALLEKQSLDTLKVRCPELKL